MDKNNYTETDLQEIETQIAKLTEQKNKIAQELLNAKAKEQVGNIIGKLYQSTMDTEFPTFYVFTEVIREENEYFVYEGIRIVELQGTTNIARVNMHIRDDVDFYDNYTAYDLYDQLAFLANGLASLIENTK